jgi:hypothetical protein
MGLYITYAFIFLDAFSGSCGSWAGEREREGWRYHSRLLFLFPYLVFSSIA